MPKSNKSSSGTTNLRGVVSQPGFEHFMTTFLWSIRVLATRNVVEFFYSNMTNLQAEFALFSFANFRSETGTNVALHIALFL